jgi:heme A synthase
MAYPAALMSFAVTLGLFILRWRNRNTPRPFKVWLPIAVIFLTAQAFLIVTPFLRPEDGNGDTSLPYWLAPFVSVIVVLGGTILWWIWRIVVPWVGYFYWESHQTPLKDGTMVRRWKKSQY